MSNNLIFRASFCFGVGCLAFAPTPSFAETFDGPYAGAEAGIGYLKSKGSTLAGPFKESDSSAIGGAVIGYRMPVGDSAPIVFGVEGNVGFYEKGSNARYGVSGIGGFRAGQSGLIYVRAGYGWLDGIDTGIGTGIDGLVVGGGAEFALSDTLSARADYKYLDYGGTSFPDNTIDFKGHELVASILFNF